MKPLGELCMYVGWEEVSSRWLPGEFEARRLDSGMQLIKNTCNVKGLRHFEPSLSLSGCCCWHFVASTEGEREKASMLQSHVVDC